MDFENMKDAFPKMPKEMGAMIDALVQEQIEAPDLEWREEKQARKGRWSSRYRRAAAFVLVILMATGSVAYAAGKLYQMYVDKQGKYQVNVGIKTADTSDTEEAERKTVPNQIPKLQLKYSYVPDGYIVKDYGLDYMQKKDGTAAIGSRVIVMSDAFINGEETLDEKYTIDSKSVTVGGHEALLYHKENGDMILNVLCPEYYQIIQIDMICDLDETEIASVMNGIQIEDTGELMSTANMWTVDQINHPEPDDADLYQYIADGKSTTIHQIGEKFQIPTEATFLPLTAVVKNVTITEDLSVLENEEEIPEEWKALQTKDGKLEPVELQFIKCGDGVDTLDQVVKTELEPVKLVDLTVEYTNDTDQTLVNALYNCSLSVMDLNENTLEMSGVYEDYRKAEDAETFDVIRIQEIATVDTTGGMHYYGTLNDEGKNYISKLEPGESITMHFAQLVFAKDVPKLYANLSNEGGGYCFTEESLKCGYVDIGQDIE